MFLFQIILSPVVCFVFRVTVIFVLAEGALHPGQQSRRRREEEEGAAETGAGAGVTNVKYCGHDLKIYMKFSRAF